MSDKCVGKEIMYLYFGTFEQGVLMPGSALDYL